RVAFILAMLLTALFCHLAFHPKGHLFNELAIHPEHTWLYRLRYLLYVLAVGAPLILAGMAGGGFYYSASQLAVRFKWTLIACGTVLLFYGIVSRWILVK